MSAPTPSKPDRIHPALIFVIVIIAGVPASLTWMFFFGKLYGGIAFCTMLVFMALATRFFRRLKVSDPEKMRRIEKALSGGEPGNDPRQMARWMR